MTIKEEPTYHPIQIEYLVSFEHSDDRKDVKIRKEESNCVVLVSLQYEHQEEDSFLLPLKTFEGFRKSIEDNQLDKYGDYPLTKKLGSNLIRIIITCGKGKDISKVYELCNRAEYSKETTKVFKSLVHEFETIIEKRP